jgi:hypothetical protein
MVQIILVLLAIGIALIAGVIQKRYGRLRNFAINILIMYVTIVLLMAIGEAYFRYFHSESGWSFTLAFHNWEDKYIDNNSLGFRDREWTPEDYVDKTKILVIGDSFTVGLGVNNPEDRFSNALADLLGDDYAVINLGVGGTATRGQIEIIENQPVQDPDIIIWQYYLNDIDDAALSIGNQWWPNLPRDYPKFIDESYLANFLFWRITPIFREVTGNDDKTYWEWASTAYDNSGIWQIHVEEINQMIAYAESRDARLIVVIFPNMQDPIGSIAYIDRVEQAILENGYTDEILKLYQDVSFLSETDQVYESQRDLHPNALFNRYLGQRIYDAFFADS